MTATLYCSESTVRIEVLGEELRRIRDACGLRLAQVAPRIGISEAHISRWERGVRAPSPEDVASLMTIYEITGDERQLLIDLAKRSGHRGLWQRQGSFESRLASLTLLESRATALVTFEPLMLPGLLQTVPYAEAVIREVGMVEDQVDIDERVIGRIHRQRILRNANPPSLLAIVGEVALRTMIGGKEVMRNQLRYLAEVAERPNVTLRVVPTAVGGHPGLDGSFMRIRFDDRPSVVCTGNRTSSLFLEDPREVSAYDRVIVELMSVAMTAANSVRLVAEMAATLE